MITLADVRICLSSDGSDKLRRQSGRSKKEGDQMKKGLFYNLSLMALVCVFAAGCSSLTDKAQQGDSVAQWQLAEKMMNGTDGYPCNPVEAKKWLEKSIAAGNLDARVVRGEFMAAGQYGSNISVDAVWGEIYPALEQNNSGRAGASYLKTVIKYNDAAHMEECVKAIEAVFAGPRKYRGEISLLLYKKLTPWMNHVLNIKNIKRLDDQKKQIQGAEQFISTGWALTRSQRHELEDFECRHVARQFNELKPLLIEPKNLIARTVEVEGRGRTPAECIQNAQQKAIKILWGISLTSSSVVKTSEFEQSGKATAKSSSDKKIRKKSSAGSLSSFTVIFPPKLGASGEYVGLFKAVRKKTR